MDSTRSKSQLKRRVFLRVLRHWDEEVTQRWHQQETAVRIARRLQRRSLVRQTLGAWRQELGLVLRSSQQSRRAIMRVRQMRAVMGTQQESLISHSSLVLDRAD